MLVLVVGDAHIPDREASIPEPIQKLLVPATFSQVVSVGNVSDSATKKLLRQLTPNQPVVSVTGSNDVPESGAKATQVFKAGKFRIGVVSSFLIVPAEDIDALSMIARQLDVDIVLWGGSHRQDTQSWAGHYFVNPGSLTGAASSWNADDEVEPAGFCLLDLEDDVCTVYMYTQNGDTVKVNKTQLPYAPRD